MRAQIARIIGQGDEVTTGQDPIHATREEGPRPRKVREALSLGHNYIGTEHILLGIVRERQRGWPHGSCSTSIPTRK